MQARLASPSSPMQWAPPGLYEYLLVAYPDDATNKKILEEKQSFYDQYRQKGASKTDPFIPVASFSAREAMEETIIRYVQRICYRQQSFTVMLNNYSGFPPDSIYLRIQDPKPFDHIVSELKAVNNYVVSCSCPPIELATNPHVTIAKGLPESVYMKALIEFGQKDFFETFMVDELVLLRRTNQFDTCKPINVFRLQPASDAFYN